jgi:SHS family lactate transporter-like MFS transporter
MGGLYGNAAATALEDIPAEARGLMSGILQQGYAFGYLLAVVFARGLVNTTPHDWRPLFWFGACPPIIFIVWRLFMSETNTYYQHDELRKIHGSNNLGKTFLQEGKVALKRHWILLTYLVLLMAGFNFVGNPVHFARKFPSLMILADVARLAGPVSHFAHKSISIQRK